MEADKRLTDKIIIFNSLSEEMFPLDTSFNLLIRAVVTPISASRNAHHTGED